MKTTEKDVQKSVLDNLIKMMNSKMLSSIKPDEEEDEDVDETDDDEEGDKSSGHGIKGVSIEVISAGKPTKEDPEEDPLQAKLRKLFGKE